jgi:AraC-like DNA-binding protein
VLSGQSPNQDDEMRGALCSLAELRLTRITRSTSYAQRVRDVLVQTGSPHRMDMQSVARRLQLSVRSLRRHLAAEGVHYDAILREALATIATELLRNDERTIQDVSDAMGFADKSTFHRAFKRWTGATPNEYRRRVLGGP